MSNHAEPSQGDEAIEEHEMRGPVPAYNEDERDFEHGDEVAHAKRRQAEAELQPVK